MPVAGGNDRRVPYAGSANGMAITPCAPTQVRRRPRAAAIDEWYR
jgi:hypothetical protein